jgi:hypothetical protein
MAQRSVAYRRKTGEHEKDCLFSFLRPYPDSTELEMRKKGFATHLGALNRLRQWLAAPDGHARGDGVARATASSCCW